MSTFPEWKPRNYLLQIQHKHCITCQSTEISSQLWLVAEHILKRDCTRRTEAHYMDARLPRGKSERHSSVPTCTQCFEDYNPVRQPTEQDLVMVHPGDPSKRLIKTLEDII